MRILAFWDIYGRIWRKSLKKNLKGLKELYNPDLTLANVDNISSGRGAVEEHVLEVLGYGVDYLFSWDHIIDNPTHINEYLAKDTAKLIRPANFYSYPGVWYKIIEVKWKKVLLVHLMWQVFMNHDVYNPFLKLKDILNEVGEKNIDVSIVDFHRETTAEIYGMAHMFDGKISLVYGTHTHIQTNDEQILKNGTGLITDIGMTGSRNSIIGASYESVEARFLTGIQKWKITQSLDENYVVNAIIVDIDDITWKTVAIEKISLKNKL